jgi:hypothetical protein
VAATTTEDYRGLRGDLAEAVREEAGGGRSREPRREDGRTHRRMGFW